MKLFVLFILLMLGFLGHSQCPTSHDFDPSPNQITFNQCPNSTEVNVDINGDGLSDYTATRVSGCTYELPIDFPTSPKPTLYSLSFGAITCSSYNQVLPVELIDFSVKADNGVIELSWKTASETNNKGFYIEKSYDGKYYNDIFFVDGKGSTSDLSEYSFKDKDLSNVIYYRLKQVDFDGRFEYSKSLNISQRHRKERVINTFVNTFLNLSDDAILYNLQGVRVTTLTRGSNDLSFIPSGFYVVRMREKSFKIFKA